MPSTHKPLSALADYQHWLSTIKQRVVSARLRVALAANSELITLYYEIGAHAIRLAQLLQQGILDAGLPLYINSPTNQQFVEFPDEAIKKLEERGVVYSFWEKTSSDKTVIRFVTSWATKEETVRKLIGILKEVM